MQSQDPVSLNNAAIYKYKHTTRHRVIVKGWLITNLIAIFFSSQNFIRITFCVGFPQTFSGAVIFLSLFICIREPSVCDVVCIRKREDTGNETLGMSVCVWRPLFVSGVVSWRIISTCFNFSVRLR